MIREGKGGCVICFTNICYAHAIKLRYKYISLDCNCDIVETLACIYICMIYFVLKLAQLILKLCYSNWLWVNRMVTKLKR